MIPAHAVAVKNLRSAAEPKSNCLEGIDDFRIYYKA